MKSRYCVEIPLLIVFVTALFSCALVEGKRVLHGDERHDSFENKSTQILPRVNRNLRDWKASWWDAAHDFELSTEKATLSEEIVPVVTISRNSPAGRAKALTQNSESSHGDDSMLGPGKVGTPSDIAKNGESFDIYEMMLYFVFAGMKMLPPSSEGIWEIVTTEHLADHIGNLCDYAYKNMDIKVTMKDQITNSSVIEIANKVMANKESSDSSKDPKDSILIMKSSVYVVLTNGIELDRTSYEIILDSFNTDKKSRTYLNRLKKTNDAAFTNLTNVSILQQLPTAILMDKPEEGTPTIGPDESQNSSDKASSGHSAFVGLMLGFSVCTLFFVGALRGPLKQCIYRKRATYTGASNILGQRGQDTFDVEIIKDSDVSTLDSRLSPYSADFHVHPETTSPSMSQRLKDRISKIAAASPVKAPKIFSPPREVFAKLKAGGYSDSFDDEDSFFELRAPPGMLGIIVESPDQAGPTVHGVKESSPFYGQVSIGDKLIAVDGEDTATMSAIRASKLISYKSNQQVRRLLFKRKNQASVSESIT